MTIHDVHNRKVSNKRRGEIIKRSREKDDEGYQLITVAVAALSSPVKSTMHARGTGAP